MHTEATDIYRLSPHLACVAGPSRGLGGGGGGEGGLGRGKGKEGLPPDHPKVNFTVHTAYGKLPLVNSSHPSQSRFPVYGIRQRPTQQVHGKMSCLSSRTRGTVRWWHFPQKHKWCRNVRLRWHPGCPCSRTSCMHVCPSLQLQSAAPEWCSPTDKSPEN